MNLTAEQANAIYDILVREAGADNREFYRHQFVCALVNGREEYNLNSIMPFPATFVNRSTWQVLGDFVAMSYQDAGTIAMVNAALDGLRTHYTALAEALS